MELKKGTKIEYIVTLSEWVEGSGYSYNSEYESDIIILSDDTTEEELCEELKEEFEERLKDFWVDDFYDNIYIEYSFYFLDEDDDIIYPAFCEVGAWGIMEAEEEEEENDL